MNKMILSVMTFRSFISNRKKPILFSVVFSIIMLILTYFIANISFPLGGEKALLRKIEFGKTLSQQKNESYIDSVLFINVTYDKVINQNPKYDESGRSVGHVAITDRYKLLELLQYLKEKNDYKYILLDVFFSSEEGDTEWDEELFSTILSMDSIVIPYLHDDGERIVSIPLLEKAGLVDYNESYFVGGFLKYPYLIDDSTSLPLKMYKKVTNREIKRYGFLYFDRKRLAKRCDVLAMEIMADSAFTHGGDKIWYHLGADVLNDSSLYNNPSLTSGKYIIIGAFKGDDEHATFRGTTSGAVINYNAFCSLMDGRHFVNPIFTIFLFLLFFFLTYFTLRKDTIRLVFKKSYNGFIRILYKIVNKKIVEAFIKFVKVLRQIVSSWISYATLLTLFCVVNYLCFGQTHEILITSTIFYLLSKIVSLNKRKQSWKTRK